jgi:hypothetical protein
MDEKKSFEFPLSKPFDYTPKGKGDFEPVHAITFRAPGMNEFDETMDLSQLVMRAFMSASKFAPKLGEENIVEAFKMPTRNEIKVVLVMSDESFKKIGGCFKVLAVKVGSIGDEATPLKLDHFNKLSMDDFNDMLCEYVVNFIFPSLFSEQGT